jgi:hypothetical protein
MWARARVHVAILAAVVGAALLGPLSATAAPPERITVSMQGALTGPGTVEGTYTVSGAVSDNGTYVETYRFAGGSIHGVKTLTGRAGTVTLIADAVIRWTSPTTAELDAGHWRLESGTGVYAGLRGGGAPCAAGSADLASGQVEVVHAGFVFGG